MDSECNAACKLRSLCEQTGEFKLLLDVQDRFKKSRHSACFLQIQLEACHGCNWGHNIGEWHSVFISYHTDTCWTTCSQFDWWPVSCWCCTSPSLKHRSSLSWWTGSTVAILNASRSFSRSTPKPQHTLTHISTAETGGDTVINTI